MDPKVKDVKSLCANAIDDRLEMSIMVATTIKVSPDITNPRGSAIEKEVSRQVDFTGRLKLLLLSPSYEEFELDVEIGEVIAQAE